MDANSFAKVRRVVLQELSRTAAEAEQPVAPPKIRQILARLAEQERLVLPRMAGVRAAFPMIGLGPRLIKSTKR